MFLSSDILKTRFFPGDLVMVRPLDEILATLDEKGPKKALQKPIRTESNVNSDCEHACFPRDPQKSFTN